MASDTLVEIDMTATWNGTILAGGLVETPGNSAERETGGWRVKRPVVEMDRCTHCMICWIFCPDSAVETGGGKFLGFDLVHCKGCGICAEECPVKCIDMIEELTLQRAAPEEGGR